MVVTGPRLVLRHDTDYDETFTFTDENGDVVNVSSDTIECSIIDGSGTELLSLTVDDGITVEDGPNGVISIRYEDTDISGVSAGDYRRYIFLTHSGKRQIEYESECTILSSVG